MAWFRKDKKPLRSEDRRDIPPDVFNKCKGCGEISYAEKLAQNFQVCPSCGHHFQLPPEQYVKILLDEGSFEEIDEGLYSEDPLGFKDLKPYKGRLKAARELVGRKSGVLTGTGTLEGLGVTLAVMDFRFIGGSMGSAVGEKIARAGRTAMERKEPLIIVSVGGGARMQEGIYSLMQMAKTSAVLAGLHEAGLPYISLMTDPTTGGVTASHAMLGDVNLAEPGALIGFAGPRVIAETIGQEVPDGFRRSEFQLQHGMIDRVVDRRELKTTIGVLLRHMIA